MDCVLWTGSLAQLYAASRDALLNCPVAVDLYEQQVGGTGFGRRTRKQPLTHSSTSTAKQNGEGNADDSRGFMKRGKNQIEVSSLFDDLPVLKVTSSYITKIEFFYKSEY